MERDGARHEDEIALSHRVAGGHELPAARAAQVAYQAQQTRRARAASLLRLSLIQVRSEENAQIAIGERDRELDVGVVWADRYLELGELVAHELVELVPPVADRRRLGRLLGVVPDLQAEEDLRENDHDVDRPLQDAGPVLRHDAIVSIPFLDDRADQVLAPRQRRARQAALQRSHNETRARQRQERGLDAAYGFSSQHL